MQRRTRRGHACVGLRHLTPIEGGTLPEFMGVTADVDVAYRAPTRTRLDVHLVCDLHSVAPLHRRSEVPGRSYLGVRVGLIGHSRF